jgi:Zn-dependent peptidase ImmA (M78 family)/DNA-binding XRE family transcriptional regulator
MSQTELARESGVSRQQIISIESGETEKPAELTVLALAAALKVLPVFLQQKPPAPPPENVLHFRGKARVTNRMSAQLLARASMWMAFTAPVMANCTLPSDSFKSIDRRGDIEDVAVRARAAWGLQERAPIHSVIRVLERSGALIGAFNGGAKGVDAYSWQDRAPHILCNADRGSPSRMRFSLMHEAGHLVLHRGKPTDKELTDEELKQKEAEADRFASAVLLPRQQFWQEFPRSGRRIHWDGLLQMKGRWGVSIQAIVHRAYDLDIIDAAVYRRAFITISSNGWRTQEPGETTAPEAPEVVTSAIEALSLARKLNASEMSRRTGLLFGDMNEMTGADISRFGDQDHPIAKISRLRDQRARRLS